MKNLNDYVYFVEAQKVTKGKDDDLDELIPKNAREVPSTNVGRRLTNKSSATNPKSGENAKSNGTRGLWDWVKVDTAPSKTLRMDIDPDELTENQSALFRWLRLGMDFFVQGEAGWAKTAQIKEVAKTFGVEIETVYLDKALPEDLTGLPIIVEDPKRKDNEGKPLRYQGYSMPEWAYKMYKNPKQKYLLFFDEFNQAKPDVQKACMPIILEHEIARVPFENFIVGAAGNMEFEAEELFKLDRRVKSRVEMYIWNCGTKEDWDQHWEWAHETYDKYFTKDGKKDPSLINELAKYWQLWSNPRDLTRKIYEPSIKFKKQGHRNDVKPDLLAKLFLNNVTVFGLDDRKPSGEELTKLHEFVAWYYKWLAEDPNDERDDDDDNVNSLNVIDEEQKNKIIKWLRSGYVSMNGSKYLCTLENILGGKNAIIDVKNNEGINREMINMIVDEMENNGIKVKYPTIKSAETDMDKKKLVLP